MNYLLDTHALIWSILEKDKLSKAAKHVLENPSHSVFVSAISFWEISLKFSLGKLELRGILPQAFPNLSLQMEFEIMPLDADCASSYHQLLTKHHRDPFDRMLIWQAIKNDLVLITKDGNMASYKTDGLKILW